MNTTAEFLTAAELACHLRMSRRSIFRHVKAGRLPQPLRITCRTVLYRVADVRRHLDGLPSNPAAAPPA